MGISDKELEQIITDCNDMPQGAESISQRDIVGTLSIEDLLQKNDFEKHVGSFELPHTITSIIDVDMFNAVVSWYLKWKISEPLANQTTCTIIRVFGYKDAIKAIVAINFYKYLRNKGYDPDIVEQFLKLQ